MRVPLLDESRRCGAEFFSFQNRYERFGAVRIIWSVFSFAIMAWIITIQPMRGRKITKRAPANGARARAMRGCRDARMSRCLMGEA